MTRNWALVGALLLLAGACFIEISDVRSVTDGQGGSSGMAGNAGAGGSSSATMTSGVTGAAGAGGVAGAGGSSSTGTAGGGGAGGADYPPSGTCELLNYDGACVGDTSIFWWGDADPPGCYVRDCTAEGVQCVMLGDGEGYGCPSDLFTEEPCEPLGLAGMCSLDGTAVWWEGGTCQWQHCPGAGLVCALDGAQHHRCRPP